MEIWRVQRFAFGGVGFDCLSKTASLEKIKHLYTLVVHFARVCVKKLKNAQPRHHKNTRWLT